MEILCFFAGIAYVYFNSSYFLLIPLIPLFFRLKPAYFLWFLAAVFFAYAHQCWHKEQGMPNEPVIKQAMIEGYIASLPLKNPTKTQFQLTLTRFNGRPASTDVLLNCYKDCPEVHAGETWRFNVKLKRPHNYGNPGGFDYIQFLQARHIKWTGYLRDGHEQLSRQGASLYPLLSLREELAERLFNLDPNEETVGITQALTLGITNHIDKEGWDLFRRTGTIHLMVISGAHIGLIAGMGYFIIRRLWGRFGRCCLYIPAQRAASVFALSMALIYAILAGFAVPAQRALIVCFFMLLRNFCNQQFSVWQAWRYSLLAVLLFEPHSVLMPGFYLSFIAVAILLLINQRFKLKGIKNTLIMQLACMAGLMPFTLYWFSYGAVNGLIANLIAVPWVGFLIIPLALVTLCLGQWAVFPGLIVILKLSITSLMHFLSWVDSLALFNLTFSYSGILHPLALITGLSILLFLPFRPLIPASIILLVAGLFPSYEQVRPGEVRIDLLDVGQGLAVVIQTARHVVIYDTGVQFFQGSDMGKMVMIPYLDTLGIKRLDKVIISHPDLDHRGGLKSLEEKYKIGDFIVDEPAFYHHGVSCYDYPAWSYDGILFQFFPLPNTFKSKNNKSCVLQVKSAGGQILLTGDIEQPAEAYLVDQFGTELHSSVLLVPHHSSKTSSSEEFLRQVAPMYAISSYGFDNPYHFPHVKTQQMYKDLKIPVFNTLDCGKISILLTKTGTENARCLYN